MNSNNFKYESGLFQSAMPLPVAALGGNYEIWFNIDDLLPTPKQWAAWNAFCCIDPEILRFNFVRGLSIFAQQMENLPQDSQPEFGPTIPPEAIAKAARASALLLKTTNAPLEAQLASAFTCDSLVIPLQDKTQVRFVEINFEIGAGFELEALFCNEQLLFIGENSGLWARTDWEYCFNISDFDPNLAEHPYW